MGEKNSGGKWGVLWSWVDSWWRMPVWYMALTWGRIVYCDIWKHSPWVRFLRHEVFWYFGLAGFVCLPMLVLVQLVRGKWKTALATAVLSAVALAPLAAVCDALTCLGTIRH